MTVLFLLAGLLGVSATADSDSARIRMERDAFPSAIIDVSRGPYHLETIVGQTADVIGAWKRASTTGFSLELPPEWRIERRQGIDSYVGIITGGGVELSYDYGSWSNPLAKDDDPDHTVTYECIDGCRAKIVVPANRFPCDPASDRATATKMTGVYFESVPGDAKLEISGRGLIRAQQALVLQIFRTIRFDR